MNNKRKMKKKLLLFGANDILSELELKGETNEPKI
jgi:hypothetical protein